jgi:hypothetical protein
MQLAPRQTNPHIFTETTGIEKISADNAIQLSRSVKHKATSSRLARIADRRSVGCLALLALSHLTLSFNDTENVII